MRRALIAKIKIAQKELGLDDGTYRAVLERVTGKRSCTECSIPELERVVEDLPQRGVAPKTRGGPPPTPPLFRRSDDAENRSPAAG